MAPRPTRPSYLRRSPRRLTASPRSWRPFDVPRDRSMSAPRTGAVRRRSLTADAMACVGRLRSVACAAAMRTLAPVGREAVLEPSETDIAHWIVKRRAQSRQRRHGDVRGAVCPVAHRSNDPAPSLINLSVMKDSSPDSRVAIAVRNPSTRLAVKSRIAAMSTRCWPNVVSRWENRGRTRFTAETLRKSCLGAPRLC